MRFLAALAVAAMIPALLAQVNPPKSAPARPTQPATNPPPTPTRNAAAALESRVPEVQFQETPLEDVMTWMSEVMRINVVVRWRELEPLGVTRATPISLHLKNLRAAQVLNVILNDAAGPDVRLGYRASQDLLLVTSGRDLESATVLKVYDVTDVIFEPLREPYIAISRDHDFVESVQPTVAAGAVAVTPITRRLRSGVTINGPTTGFPVPGEGLNYGDDARDQPDTGNSEERRMQELINVITSSIDPESWDVSGGRGSIRAFRKLLVVRASPLVHQQIGGALSDSDAP